jgi:hypothetical protein
LEEVSREMYSLFALLCFNSKLLLSQLSFTSQESLFARGFMMHGTIFSSFVDKTRRIDDTATTRSENCSYLGHFADSGCPCWSCRSGSLLLKEAKQKKMMDTLALEEEILKSSPNAFVISTDDSLTAVSCHPQAFTV